MVVSLMNLALKAANSQMQSEDSPASSQAEAACGIELVASEAPVCC
jgi:hypothetical protein